MLCAPGSAVPEQNSSSSAAVPLKSQHLPSDGMPPYFVQDAGEFTVALDRQSRLDPQTIMRVYYATIEKLSRQQWMHHRRHPPYSFLEMRCLHSIYAKTQLSLLGVVDVQPPVYLAGEDTMFTQPVETMACDWEDYMDNNDCSDSGVSSSGNSRVNSVESLTPNQYGPSLNGISLDQDCHEPGYAAYETSSEEESTWYPASPAYLDECESEHQMGHTVYEEESLSQYDVHDLEAQEISDDDYDWCPCDHTTTQDIETPVYYYHHHDEHHRYQLQQPQQQRFPDESFSYYHEPHQKLQYYQSSINYHKPMHMIHHWDPTCSLEAAYQAPVTSMELTHDQQSCQHGYGTSIHQDSVVFKEDIVPVINWVRGWRFGQAVVDVLHQALTRAEIYEKEIIELEATHQTAPSSVTCVDVFCHKVICIVRLWHFLFLCAEAILTGSSQ